METLIRKIYDFNLQTVGATRRLSDGRANNYIYIYTSAAVTALLLGIGAMKIKPRFTDSSLDGTCGFWHSYFYTNVCCPKHNHTYGRVIVCHVISM